jgi:hypothetical protein
VGRSRPELGRRSRRRASIFWTLIAVVLAIALVVLSFLYARRTTGPAPAPD